MSKRETVACLLGAVLALGAAIDALAQEESPAYRRAAALVRQGKVEEASAVLARRLAEVPRDVDSCVLLSRLHDYDGRALEAIQVLDEGLENSPGEVELLWEIGELHTRLGKDGPNITHKRGFEYVLFLEPRSPTANRALTEFHEKQGNSREARIYRNKTHFYDWLPPFVDLEYSEARFQALERLVSLDPVLDDPEEGWVGWRATTLARLEEDSSSDALAFLAAMCWNHGSHMGDESRAFGALAKHGEKSVPILLGLLQEAPSRCTQRQAAEALAGMKAMEAVEPMIAMLPGDIDSSWPLHLAEALARLGDARAVSALLGFADVGTERMTRDGDLIDSMHQLGVHHARCRAVLALGTFREEKETILPELKKGLENPELSAACLGALFRLTRERSYLDRLRSSVPKDTYAPLSIALFADTTDAELQAFSGGCQPESEEPEADEADGSGEGRGTTVPNER